MPQRYKLLATQVVGFGLAIVDSRTGETLACFGSEFDELAKHYCEMLNTAAALK